MHATTVCEDVMKQSSTHVILGLLCVCMAWIAGGTLPAAVAQDAGGQPAAGRYAGLADRLRALITANGVPLADAGVKIVSVTAGRTLLDNYGDKLFIPASNQKLVTTAAALHLLGPEFKFETPLYARGRLYDGGVFGGDLIVGGCGDPDISGRTHGGDPCFLFRMWAKSLKDFGIKEIRGNVIGDASAFDTVAIHPSWPANQVDRWYCAPTSALMLNDNCLDVTVSAGAGSGMPVRLTESPEAAYIDIGNHCMTTNVKAEHAYGFLGRAGSEGLIVRGKFWIGAAPATSWIPVEDPPAFFLTLMRETLIREGIPVIGKPVVATEPVAVGNDEKLVGTYVSSLDKAVLVANKNSQNLYAEQILKVLGWKLLKKGSFENGAAKVKEFLSAISPAGSACVIDDGSGLSRKNQLSANALADLLVWVVRQPEAKIFIDSLSVSGVDGTMDDRLREPPYRGRVKAKTGTVAGASSLSGYIEVPGDVFAFSMLMNSPKAGVWRMKQAQDAICKEIIDFHSAAAGR